MDAKIILLIPPPNKIAYLYIAVHIYSHTIIFTRVLLWCDIKSDWIWNKANFY